MLLPQAASRTGYVPGFFPANHRLLDGRTISARRGNVHLSVPWAIDPLKVQFRIFRLFNVLGHPPMIDGFLGHEFLKHRRLHVDYANVTASLS